MPFSGPDDSKLPDRIKGLSAPARRAFVGAFNSAEKDDPDNEGKAFAIANAAANKAGEKAMPEGVEIAGAKYHDDGETVQAAGWEPPAPFGGATSFEEMDRANAEQRRASALSFTFDQFGALVGNAMRNDDLTPGQKVERMRALIDELSPRVDSVVRDPEVAFKEATAERGSDEWEPWTTDTGGFTAFKDANGEWRWVAIHTNRYEDNVGEIFAEKAHKGFVDWVEDTKQYPPLRFWHVPVDLGPSDFLDYSDGFMVSSGTFHPGMKSAAEALSKMKNLGCSHGYIYKAGDLVGGVYQSYRSFEISVLPVGKAANRLTQFIAGRDIPMISGDKRDAAVAIFGEAGVKAIDDATAELDGVARFAGLRYKDLAALGLGGGEEGNVPDETTTAAASAVTEAPAPDPPAETPAAPAETPAAAAPAETPAEGAAAPAEAAPAEGAPAPPADTTAAAEPDGTPSASVPPAPALVDAVAAKALEPIMAGMKALIDEALTPLRDQNAALAAEVAGLKATDDAKMAALVQPRVGPSYVEAAASRAAGTEISEVPASVAAGVKDAEQGMKGDADPNALQGIERYLASARMTAARGSAGDVE